MILLRYFVGIIILFKLYTVVMGDLRKLIWDLKRNEKEELLERFIIDAESYLMQNCPSRQTTIIALNNQLLRAVTTIFKNRPYFVGTNSKFLIQSREYAKRSCVFIFIDTIDYDYLTTIFSDLPSDYTTKVRIVSKNKILKNEVQNTLDLAYDKSIENVTMIFPENNEFKGFQVYPFTKNCSREIRVSFVWNPNKGLRTYNYDDYSLRNLNKCPVTISAMPFDSTMIYDENPNGTLNVSGGSEGNIILTFAEKLNFTSVVKYPDVQDWERVINNTIVGLVGDVVNKKSLMAIGYLLPTVRRQAHTDFTTSYDYVCVVWTTPMIKVPAEDVLYSEFSIYLWAAIVLAIIFSCLFIYNISRIRSNNRKRQSYIDVVLNVIRATFGIAVQEMPTNRPGKIYFLLYIFWTLVIITAYQTYLASILTVRRDAQLIKTDADIAGSKLIPGGSSNMLSILESEREESPYMPYLIDHYEVFIGNAAALDRIKYKKDFAFAFDISTMRYYARNLTLAGKVVYFYSFDKCIVSYHQIILVRKGSALTAELNDIIKRLRESGLINFWKNEKSNVDIDKEADVKLQKLNLMQLQSIFLIYLSGLILSTVVLIFEIFSSWSKRRN